MSTIQLYDKNRQLSSQVLSQVAYIEKQLQGSHAWSEQSLDGLLSLKHNHLLFILSPDADSVMAYCLYQSLFEDAEILRLGTAKNWQRKGIARQLLIHLFERCQSDPLVKIERVLLEVRADNQPAISLYQSLGFQQIDCRKGYYKQANTSAVDGLIMQNNF